MKRVLKKLTAIGLALGMSISPVAIANNAYADDVENPIEFDWYDEIKDASAEKISNKVYTGSYIKPSVELTYKGKTLVKDKSYTVSYKNNKYVGKATITVKGINDFKGTKTITFKIVPKKVSSLKTKGSTSSIALTWNKSAQATNYEIYRATSQSGQYEKIATTTNSSFTDKNVSKTKIYYYKVRAYKTVSSVKYYSSYSSAVTGYTIPAKPVITVASTASKAIEVKYNKITGAKGYEIYRKIGSTGEYKKVATISSGSTLSYKQTGLTKGKTYYYKVRAYKIVDGSKKYGSYSTEKYAKCK